MKKRIVLVVAIILVAAVCLAAFVGCDGSARNVKYIGCDDYLFETGVNVTMAKRLPKTARWGSDMEAIKFKKGLAELFDLMQMQDKCKKTLMDGYILIEKEGSDKLYSWGIFPMSAWIEDYNGEYDYVLTNMTCYLQEDNDDYYFFFPIHAMERPLLHWQSGKNIAFNMTIDELDKFYVQHGFTTEILDNVLIVHSPESAKNAHDFLYWEVTFNGDGTVSVGNFPPLWWVAT